MAKEYIEREALIDCIEGTDWYHITSHGSLAIGAADDWDAVYKATDIYEAVKNIPAADVVEARYGEWVYDPNGMDWGLGAWLCSLCAVKNDNLGMGSNINPYLFAGSKYCPHCGAKMGRKGESE